MMTKKILSFLCAAVMILTAVQIPAFAASVVEIDISRNQTEFSLADGDEMMGTILVYGKYDDDTVARITQGLTFESSDASVVDVDANSGAYTVLAEGASIITVKYGAFSKSMVFYRTDVAMPYRRTSCDTPFNPYSSSNIITKSAEDYFYGDLFPNESMIFVKNAQTDANTSFKKTSYVTGAWFYDRGKDVAASYFGFGFGKLNSDGTTTASNDYIRIGADTKTLDKYRITYSLANSPTVTGGSKTITRTANSVGWHQIIAFVSYDDIAGNTTIKFYLDGVLFDTVVISKILLPRKHYILNRSNGTTSFGVPFKRLFVGETVTVEDADYVDATVTDGETGVATDASFEFSFNRSLDKDSDDTIIDAYLTEIATGENIEVETEIIGSKIKVTPIYPLMKGREYEISVYGSVGTVAGIFAPATYVSFDSGPIMFETELAEYYAEDLSLIASGDEVEFSASYVNNSGTSEKPYMVISQYEDDSAVAISAKKMTASPDSLSADLEAESVEGYVVSSITDENVEILAMPETAGEAYEREEITAEDEDGSYAEVGYNAESETVEVHIASKTKRAGIPVLLRVLKKGADISEATAETIDEFYDRFELLVTGEGGKLDYEFYFEGEEGEHQVIVNMALEEEPFTTSMKYLSNEKILEEIGKIQSATQESAEEVFDAAREFLDINYAPFDLLENKEIVYNALSSAEACGSLAEFSELFDDTVELVATFENNDFDNIKELCAEAGLSSLSVYDEYISEDFSEDKREELSEKLLEALSEGKKWQDTFKDFMVVEKLATVQNFNQLYTVIEDLNDVLLLDLDEYNDLSSNKKSKAMLELSENISSVSGIEELREEFDLAIEAAQESGGGGGGGGGGGNSSGGLEKGSGDDLTTTIDGLYVTPKEEAVSATTPAWVEEERMLKERKVFDDLESVSWAEDSIRELYNRGVLSGKSEKLFAPNDRVTREEICKMLVLALGIAIPENTQMPFYDTDSAAWYAPYVAAAQQKGIVNGKSDTLFGTGDFLTREELCALADRAAISAGIFLDDEFTIVSFDDEMQISSWALSSVRKMRESLIVNGMDGNYFRPSEFVTRAQAAKIIYGVVQYAAE